MNFLVQVSRTPPPSSTASPFIVLMSMACPCVFMLIFLVPTIAGMWKVFEKAGRPGWEAIVPIYNNYVFAVEILKKEILWFILMFIPFVNIVIFVLLTMELAKAFGKSEVYGLGLAFLPFVFFPMLGFGPEQFQGTGSMGTTRRLHHED